MKLYKTNGFTLIELMVVVGIIGAFSAIAIPAYNTRNESVEGRKEMMANERLDSSWRLERGGTQVYEFTPKTASHIQCVYVVSYMYQTSGLQCFEKKAKE